MGSYLNNYTKQTLSAIAITHFLLHRSKKWADMKFQSSFNLILQQWHKWHWHQWRWCPTTVAHRNHQLHLLSSDSLVLNLVPKPSNWPSANTCNYPLIFKNHLPKWFFQERHRKLVIMQCITFHRGTCIAGVRISPWSSETISLHLAHESPLADSVWTQHIDCQASINN